jgi:uncharacterized membrane protein HdeD (DUF308 family)
VLLRGIFAIVFGVIALISPFAALTALAIVFGIYAIIDGITAIVHAFRARPQKGWGWLLAEGIISLLAGILVLVLPAVAVAIGGLVVLWTIVIWSFMIGVLRLSTATGAPGSSKTWAIIAGVVSILFAIILTVLIFVTPGATLLGLAWAVGIYAIVFGLALVVASFQLRSIGKGA